MIEPSALLIWILSGYAGDRIAKHYGKSQLLGAAVGVVVVGFSLMQYKKYKMEQYRQEQERLRAEKIASGEFNPSKDLPMGMNVSPNP
jgi:hypothetical protein